MCYTLSKLTSQTIARDNVLETITPLNLILLLITFAALLFGIFGRKERSLEKRISDQEDQKERRDQRSISTLYIKHDELVTDFKQFKEKINTKYWTKEDVKEHLDSNNKTFEIVLSAQNKTFQVKLDHMDKTIAEIKALLTDHFKKEG